MDGLIANSKSTQAGIFNSFTYGNATLISGGASGRYRSLRIREVDPNGGGGTNSYYMYNTDSPIDTFLGDVQTDLNSTYFPILDRALGGSVFNPAEYQLEVEFKPNAANATPFFNVILEQHDGFNDDPSGIGKRSGQQIGYQIGGTTTDTQINNWYAAHVQPNGYATWTTPITSVSFTGKTFMFEYGNSTYRDNYVLDGADGADFNAFQGNAIGAPNGAAVIHVQSPQTAANWGPAMDVEFKSVRVVKINKDPNLYARMDGQSGVSYVFGSGFSRNTATGITIDGTEYYPSGNTDQLSRFNQSGLTNIVINTDDDAENSSFGQYGVASYQTFDGTTARVDVRAKLTQALANSSQVLTLILKDLDGNDEAANQGAEQYTFNLPLNQFNTSTFTTVSVPLTSFSRTATAYTFTNSGDGSLTDFNLYEFGGFIGAGSGTVHLEIESLEIRKNVAVLAGDYNSDGKVDAADYVVWRNVNGQANTLPNDPAGGATVGIAQYNQWRANFGSTAGSGAGLGAAAVPEPGIAIFALLALCPGAVLRRIRGSN
ncbi:MAG: hypothetical protein U0805_03500 [Pirellulales bacterium]